jgi:hypothetical protein
MDADPLGTMDPAGDPGATAEAFAAEQMAIRSWGSSGHRGRPRNFP